MKIENQYTVLIVGAGPVGLVAAHYLEKFCIKTLLIDKAEMLHTYPRAIGIDDEVLRILRNLCLNEEDIKRLCDKPRVQYFTASGQHKTFMPDADFCPFEYPILSTFYQPSLEKLLSEKLTSTKYVQFFRSCELIDLQTVKDGYQVALKYQDQVKDIKVNYILGCDGGKSTVRNLCGIPFNELCESEDWMVIDMKDSEQLQKNIEKISKEGACQVPVVTINFPPQMRRFEIKVESNVPSLKSLSGFFDGIEPDIIRERIYKRSFCIAEKFSAGNIYLLGDAAHLVPPYGGQGMCSGIRDADNVCWKLASVIHGDSPPALLNSYHAERAAAIRSTMTFIQSLAKNVKVSTHDEANTVISSNYYRKIKHMPKYSSLYQPDAPLSGCLLPSIFIKSEDDEIKRLDDRLSQKWVLLADQKYQIYFEQQVLGVRTNLNGVFIDTQQIKNDKNIHSLNLYEDDIGALLQNGFGLIIRPDLYIVTTITAIL